MMKSRDIFFRLFSFLSLFLLLSLKPLIGLAAEGSSTTTLSAPLQGHVSNAQLKLQSLEFYYKLEAETRYLDLKTEWRSAHFDEITLCQANELAVKADLASELETPFQQWRYQGGPAPRVFTAKAHIYSTGAQALLNVPFTITVRAKVGELMLIPSIQMTDYKTLEATARWLTISKQTIRVPAIATGEDLLLPLMEFQLLDFEAQHPNQFPIAIEVQIASPFLPTSSKTLTLRPDHFVVPVEY